jgi:4-oxalocrotonate tautomerase
MPHVIVKMLSGRSDKQKKQLAEEITKVVMRITGNGEEAVSVSIEDVAQGDWTEKVYKPDIAAHWDELYKKPGYDPFA